MSRRFRIEHVNRYRYDHSVALNYGEARLLLRSAPGQRVLETTLDLSPAASDYRERGDAWGNRVAWFSLRHPHRELILVASSLVERDAASMPEASAAWEEVVAHLRRPHLDSAAAESVAAREFSLESPLAPWLPAARDYAGASFAGGRPLLDAVADLSGRIRADFAYRPSATQIDTPLSEVLAERHGVCQDFAHLALAGLRGLGLAARYVSGYLETTPPQGEPRRVGADASHAWISVYLPQVGWFDFDPTNGGAAGSGHITLAWGRDYSDVTPLKGVIYGGGMHRLEVGVTVTRVPDI